MTESPIRLERLTEENFETFSSFLNRHDSGCYCSFWHQKFTSMDEWDKRKAEEPEKNKACMLEKVRARFHPGVLAYQGRDLVAWVSVGPMIDFYWAWKRVAQIGEGAKTVAAIPCITRGREFRDRVSEASILKPLLQYGKQQGWTAIEGFPFDREAIDRSGDAITWAGFPEEFLEAGFRRNSDHWLSSKDAPRSIYRVELS